MTCGELMRLALLGVVANGCSESLCNPALSPSGTYSLQLLAPYSSGGPFTFSAGSGDHDPSSQGSCQGFDGLAAGTTLVLRGSGESDAVNDMCNDVTTSLENPPAALTVVGPTSDQQTLYRAKGSDGLYFIAEVKVGACEGTLLIKLYAGGAPGGLFSAPVNGEAPPAIVYRLFVPTSAQGSCQVCDDNFAASVAVN
jgi:hypothetical protein